MTSSAIPIDLSIFEHSGRGETWEVIVEVVDLCGGLIAWGRRRGHGSVGLLCRSPGGTELYVCVTCMSDPNCGRYLPLNCNLYGYSLGLSDSDSKELMSGG